MTYETDKERQLTYKIAELKAEIVALKHENKQLVAEYKLTHDEWRHCFSQLLDNLLENHECLKGTTSHEGADGIRIMALENFIALCRHNVSPTEAQDFAVKAVMRTRDFYQKSAKEYAEIWKE